MVRAGRVGVFLNGSCLGPVAGRLSARSKERSLLPARSRRSLLPARSKGRSLLLGALWSVLGVSTSSLTDPVSIPWLGRSLFDWALWSVLSVSRSS